MSRAAHLSLAQWKTSRAASRKSGPANDQRPGLDSNAAAVAGLHGTFMRRVASSQLVLDTVQQALEVAVQGPRRTGQRRNAAAAAFTCRLMPRPSPVIRGVWS
jgi:hypothetical protein